jgi:anti-sigma factor RsiW
MTTALHLDDLQAQRLLDGQLPAAEQAAAERHLAACPDCALLVESYRALASALDGLEIPLVPAGFTDGVLARVEELESSAARERRLALSILAAVACAAAAVAAFVAPAAFAPALSRVGDVIGGAATWLRLGADVVGPVVRALRLEIAAANALAALPLLALLRRLSPRHSEVSA